MKESFRPVVSKANLYLHNARDILKKAPREGRVYTDIKPIREACGTAYLAVLEAINEYLLMRGLTKKELPKSVDEYRKVLRKYIAIRDGKLFKEFEMLYDALHIAGYYRGLLSGVNLVKEVFEEARYFIEKLGK